ncbi:hypothetical protein [Moorena sp. SIOASIH]|nr:hypothetical protein [Moorena sp. SIOASIH]
MFPTPYSLLPTPYSLFPIPCSLCYSCSQINHFLDASQLFISMY